MNLNFDTRNKKPKLYHLIGETLIAGGIVFALTRLDTPRSSGLVGLTVSLFLLAVVAQLIVAFFRQMEYNSYSYNTIFYFGFALFLFAVFLLAAHITVLMFRDPEVYQPRTVSCQLVNSAKTFMIFTFPFILIFSSALCVSNIALIRHEGRRVVNVLGIVLSVLLVGGVVLLWHFDFAVSGSEREVMIHDLITNVFAAVYLYFECMIIGTIVADAIAARYEPAPDKDFLIVLGCGLRPDGTPTPLLRGRLDRALAFAEKQKRLTGKDLTFVTSGGKGPDEVVSESAAMTQYLLERGVSPERILQEDQSSSTFENMKFSKEKILAVNPAGKVAFATTNYHVFRSGLFARRVKMRAVGMGAHTKWYFWPNAAVREFVGLVTEHRLKQAVILLSIVATYLILTILNYRV